MLRVNTSSIAPEMDAPSFCRPPDATPRLAVIGALGVEKQLEVRDAIRQTWLPLGASADMLALFVLRGIGLEAGTISEAGTQGDIVFVRSEASLPRLIGPLWSSWLWLECAVQAWPNAQLIGKAETDTWIDLPGVAARIHADLAAIDLRHDRAAVAAGPPQIYWGVMESFHWNLHDQRPKGFSYKFGGSPAVDCRVRGQPPSGSAAPAAGALDHHGMMQVALPPNGTSAADAFVGPFHFAKGPLVLVSRSLLPPVVASGSWPANNLHRITESVQANDAVVIGKGVDYPQDDTWLGMALTTSVEADRRPAASSSAASATPPPPPRRYALHAGSVVYGEGFADRAYPVHSTTLIWHNGHALNKLDHGRGPNASHGLAARIRAFHQLLMRDTPSRCQTPNTTLNCQTPAFRGCGGAAWHRCLVVHNYNACPRVRLGSSWG